MCGNHCVDQNTSLTTTVFSVCFGSIKVTERNRVRNDWVEKTLHIDYHLPSAVARLLCQQIDSCEPTCVHQIEILPCHRDINCLFRNKFWLCCFLRCFDIS